MHFDYDYFMERGNSEPYDYYSDPMQLAKAELEV